MKVLIHAWHSATTGDSVLVEYVTAWLKERFKAQVEWASPLKQPSMIKDFDVLILGPCGVIYDLGPGPSGNYVDYMTSWLFEAHKLGKPIIAFNVGVQEIRRREKAEQWAEALNHCEVITTRSPESTEILREIGVRTPIETCMDLAYSLPCFTPKVGSGPTRPVLGINLKRHHGPWRKALEELKEISHPKFLVFMISEEKIGVWLNLPWDPFGSYSLQNIGQVYGGLDLLVSSHFHGHVFAVMGGIPFLQLLHPEGEHEKKSVWSLHRLGWSHTWSYEDPSDTLIGKVKALMLDCEDLRRRLEKIRIKMRPLALRNFGVLQEYLT